jgi:predicted metalloprotease
MDWQGNRESDNVEDRRDSDYGGGGGGLVGGLLGGRGVGVGTIVLALLAGWIFDINPLTILSAMDGGPPVQHVQQVPAHRPPADDQMAKFVSVVLADTEDVWGEIFRRNNAQYPRPKLVLFRGATPTACGRGQSAMGPFYCPGDRKVYLDMAFFREMETRFRAGGDFARAYVIAHEIGHHVQNLTGITAKTDALRERMSTKDYNRVSVRIELQADCFAGVWAQHANRAKPFLDPQDVDEALRAANAIGDDMLQKQARGVVVPDSFTHGSSAQRMRWFKTGFETGSMKACDTFASRDL